MTTHRYIVQEAFVEDEAGLRIGRIGLLRMNSHDPGRFQWRTGYPSPSVEKSGVCSTYEEAVAALDAALAERGAR